MDQSDKTIGTKNDFLLSFIDPRPGKIKITN